MDDAIDYGAVIHQLQLENEMLRSNMKVFVDLSETIYKVPNLLEELWRKATANKYSLLIGVMVLYWAASIAMLVWDRWPKGA